MKKDLDDNRHDTVKVLAGGLVRLRGPSDTLPQQWWVASTVLPLVAAAIGPLSSVLSIAALTSPWRVTLPNGVVPSGSGRGTDDAGVGIRDPEWELVFNAVSLACGFAGNIFLLLHFASRVRYMIALPLAIVCWFLSALILVLLVFVMHVHVPPNPPQEIYSQGFWHAVLAACLYFIGGVILAVNLLGCLRGHYPQQFDLDDNQRTLILQTITFFVWLAGGSAVFSTIEGFTYADALYYADVSVLTIGFGDFAPQTDPGRGFLLVFQLVGIIFLGLVITSISKFAANVGADRIVKQYQLHARNSAVGREVAHEHQLGERPGLPPQTNNATGENRHNSLTPDGRLGPEEKAVAFLEDKPESTSHEDGMEDGENDAQPETEGRRRSLAMRAREMATEKRQRRRQKLLLLRRERDRFNAMRSIQKKARRWNQYWALGMSLLAFGLLWCLGALVFMLTERHLAHLRYFECLYFCFSALLTIGYGDFSPKSNLGKPFFVVWSLFAVPIVTLLVREMSTTVASAVNRGTFTLADWTVLPKRGVLADWLARHPRARAGLQYLDARRRVRRGFQVHDPNRHSQIIPVEMEIELSEAGSTLDLTNTRTNEDGGRQKHAAAAVSLPVIASEVEFQVEPPQTEHDLAREITEAIKSVAHDLRSPRPRRYTYDEWKRFIRLMRFRVHKPRHPDQGSLPSSTWASSSTCGGRDGSGEADERVLHWDWIGEDSPLLADIIEAEWVLDRLCESLDRYLRRQGEENQHVDNHDAAVDKPNTTDAADEAGPSGLAERIQVLS